jgi:hypothetical protein
VVFLLESQANYLNSQLRKKNLFSTSNRKHSLFEKVNPLNIFKNFNKHPRKLSYYSLKPLKNFPKIVTGSSGWGEGSLSDNGAGGPAVGSYVLPCDFFQKGRAAPR